MDGQRTTQPERIIRRALITGASGMLGATTARLLLSRGVFVTAVIRPDSPKRKNLPENDPRLTIVEADLIDLKGLLIPEGTDVVFHFAWAGTFGDGRNAAEAQKQNVSCTLELLRKAAAGNVKAFVGAGSQAEFGPHEELLTPDTDCRPETEYGKAKLEAFTKGRELAKELGIDFIWTRILSVYGPFDNAHSMVESAILTFLRNEKFSCTKGEQLWDYIYAEDAAELFVRLAERGETGRSYIVSGGHGRRLREYIADIRDAVDPNLSIGFGEKPYPPHQVMHLVGDMTKTIETTGFTPKTPFSAGIEKTVRWTKEQEQ